MDEYLTVDEAAPLLRISCRRVRDYARQQILPSYRFGKRWLFRRRELHEFLCGFVYEPMICLYPQKPQPPHRRPEPKPMVKYDPRIRRVRRATPRWAKQHKIDAIYAKAKERSARRGIAFHVDHVIPIAGKLVCGLHVHTNLQIIKGRDNCQKGNRWTDG